MSDSETDEWTADGLKALRYERNATQKEMAEELGVVERTYRRYETGERTIPKPVAKVLTTLSLETMQE